MIFWENKVNPAEIWDSRIILQLLRSEPFLSFFLQISFEIFFETAENELPEVEEYFDCEVILFS